MEYLSSDLKSANIVNSFKHKIKDNFFQNIQREEGDIYVYPLSHSCLGLTIDMLYYPKVHSNIMFILVYIPGESKKSLGVWQAVE